MVWKNRISSSMKSRSSHNAFRKLTGDEGEDNDDLPLLLSSSTTSSLVSTPPSMRGCFVGKNNSPADSNSSRNLAAVPDEIEALSFPDDHQKNNNASSAFPFNNNNNKYDFDCEDNNNNNSSSNYDNYNEAADFVAQFEPATSCAEIEEATVFDDFDDLVSNEASVYTGSGSSSKDTKEISSFSKMKPLRPPGDITSRSRTKSIDNGSKKSSASGSRDSKTSYTSGTTGSISRSGRSSATSKRSRSRTVIEEDADAATWKVDEIDAIVDADDFGNNTRSKGIEGLSAMEMMKQAQSFEISGLTLLAERDNSVNELQEVSHLMTFNALVLIQKQKDWIEGSSDATNGANRGGSSMITMELENLERKIKLMMDHKEWPNEKERKKQEKDPLTPSKAFFKVMALIDKSIEQFHKGYVKYMSDTNEENRKFKARVDELEAMHATLQDEASRSRQKTETIRNLQQERDDLKRKVDRTDERLSSLVVKSSKALEECGEGVGSISPNSNKELSKYHIVKSYIHKLEVEREKYLAEIQSLKENSIKEDITTNNLITPANENDDDNNSTSSSPVDDLHKKEGKESNDERGSSSFEEISIAASDDSHDDENVLDDDLGSQWHTLHEKDEALALAASREQDVNKLTAKVAERDSALTSLRSECKLMRMQLLQLETNRNEYKSQCDSKDSMLSASQDRIATLEDEVLRTHARCATYEEDFEALRDSFLTQKMAIKQEMAHSQSEFQEKMESLEKDFEEKLRQSEKELNEVKSDKERLIRDMKASVEDVESERNSLRSLLVEERNNAAAVAAAAATAGYNGHDEEKKEPEDCNDAQPNTTTDHERLKELEEESKNFEHLRLRLAEKATNQALTIATLQEENEMKDEQLKSLNEMVEMLLSKTTAEDNSNSNRSMWGQRLRSKTTDFFDRSRHGNNSPTTTSTSGSMNTNSMHGTMNTSSMHGTMNTSSMHGFDDVSMD